MPVTVRRVPVCLAVALAGSGLLGAEPPAIDFQRQIRPILSDNCFLCHGPDKGTRMVDLRLDTREGAMAPRKNGTPIVPGKPGESLAIARIFAEKPAMRMPPVSSHRSLTPEQKDTIRRWIEQGAPWKEQWAFIAPTRPALPATQTKAWPRNAIDHFILAKLEAAGLQPAPEADKRTLLRRVSLDLTGLPPAPADVDVFLKDKSQDAYEKVVDRLLASPRYGEHRARYWLDAARYADTQGIHVDNYREMWPYRDWVIEAFNRNMPFNQFTVEQIAGDLLPNASLAQKVASGFHRCNSTTNEGGSIPEEVAAMYAKDRADTTGAVWMGLTVGCATCHDHKFDPISQKDFYAITAFFRNTTQNPMDGNIPDTPPAVVVPRPEDQQPWLQLSERRARLRQTLADAAAAPSPAFEQWLQSPERPGLQFPARLVRPALSIELANDAKLLRHDVAEPIALSEGVSLGNGPGASGKALHFGKKAFLSLPNLAEIEADKPFTIATTVFLPKEKGSFVIASQFEPEPQEKPKDDIDRRRGWILEIGGQSPSIKLSSGNEKYLSARPGPDYELKTDAWYNLVFTYDGSRERSGLAIYVNGQLVPTYGTGEDIYPLQGTVRTQSALRLGNDKKNFYEDGAIADFLVLSQEADAYEAELLSAWGTAFAASRKAAPELTAAERTALQKFYLYQRDPASRATVAELRQVDLDRRAIARRGATTMVMQERSDKLPIAHILKRGQYDQPGAEVQPNVPSVLPPMTASMPRNRLGLAQWLVDPANPLTARVTVNRFWQELFGTGIVKTPEDFGSQGEPAVNPEMLDWLAVEFRDSGWDVKHEFKLMVMSAAYRQSALTSPEKIQKDPDNRLISRGPRFRMDAEMVRDYALAASGLLRPNIGGPSVKPYQPGRIWETVAMEQSNTRFYKPDAGDKNYRRSLYTFWKRAAPPASMDIFNAPSREACTVRRERTDTPLQALVTMNDTQFVEAARYLAERALRADAGNLDRQVDFMTSRLLARPLEPREREIVRSSYRDYLKFYSAHRDDAEKLLHVGQSKADAGIARPQFAALAMVANEMMNMDEVLNK